MIAFILAAAAQIAATETTTTPRAQAALNQAIGAGLQANGPRALTELRGIPAKEYSGKPRTIRDCLTKRLRRSSPEALPLADSPFATAILSEYRRYWHSSILGPEARTAQEATLLKQLGRLAGREDLTTIEDLEPVIKERLKADGYYALMGRTGLLQELMLWRSQRNEQRSVNLPEGPYEANVALLDDFVSLGWGNYATCGAASTGGWATGDTLYAVVPRYPSLDSEEFRVTFLGHETQHFADLKHFPGLLPWELEYRAKLTELSFADTTLGRVLTKLGHDQGDDPGSPHSYANKRVFAAIRKGLGLSDDADLNAVQPDALRASARAQLEADTVARRAASPKQG